MGADELQIRVTAQIDDLIDGLNRASDTTQAATEAMTRGFAGIGSTLDDVRSKISAAFEATGIAVAVEGVKKLSAAIDGVALGAVQLRNTAAILGVSSQAMQGLSAAADEAGVGTQTLFFALEQLSLRMQQARDGSGQMQDKLAAVGISLDNLRDPSFTAVDAAQAIAESHATAAEKMDVVGRRGLALLPVLAGLAGGEQGAIDKARELGALTDEQIEILARYHAQISEATQRWNNYKDSILVGVAPALGDLMVRLTEVFGTINDGTATSERFADVMRGIEAEVLKWAAAFKQLYLDVSHVFTEIGVSAGNVAAVIAAAAQGQFSRASSIWKEGTADLLAIDQKYAADVLANEQKLQSELAGVQNSQLQEVHPTARKRPTEDNTVTVPFDKMKVESDKYAELEIRNANQILDAMKKAAEEELQATEDTKVGEIAAAQKALQEQLKSGQISATQFLAQDKALIQQKLDAELDYYQKKASLAVGDEVELAKIDAEIAKAHAKALQEMQQADNTAHQAQLAQWKTLGNSIESSFNSNLKGMLEGTKTLGDAMRSVFASAIDGIIDMFLKMGEQAAANWITQQTLSKTTAIGQISANAGVAATAAMASVAAIPYYGWAMAPGVGASTLAEALSYEGMVSAAGGMDVPPSVNPLAQLHAKEMVLPASLADAVRSMASQPGTLGGGTARAANGGAAGSKAPVTNVQFPGSQVGNVFMMNLDDLRDAINTLVRRQGGQAVFQ